MNKHPESHMRITQIGTYTLPTLTNKQESVRLTLAWNSTICQLQH